MTCWECQACGYQYDPEKGDKQGNIAPGTAFEALPSRWRCPHCRARKDEFEPVEEDFANDEDAGDDSELEDEEEGDDAVDPFADDDSDGEEDGEEDEDEDGEGEPEDPADSDPLDAAFDAGENEDEVDEGTDVEGGDDDDDRAFSDEGADDDDVEEAEEPSDELGDDFEDAYAATPDDDPEDEPSDAEPTEDGDEDESIPDSDETAFVCADCGWVYRPEAGYLDADIPPGTPFHELLEDWRCPSCGAGPERFTPQEGEAPLPMPRPSQALQPARLPVVAPPQPSTGLDPRPFANPLDALLFRPQPIFEREVVGEVRLRTILGPRTRTPVALELPFVLTAGGDARDLQRLDAFAQTLGTCGLSEEAGKAALLRLPVDVPLSLPVVSRAKGVLFQLGWPGAPSHSPALLRHRMAQARTMSGGPVGLILPAGSIEADLVRVLEFRPDIVLLEGFGASKLEPAFLNSVARLPIATAVVRARRMLDAQKAVGVTLLASGELSSAADVARILALGADGVVLDVGTMRMRSTGDWSALAATALESTLQPLLQALVAELKVLCRYVGRSDVHALSRSDLISASRELAFALHLPFLE